MDTPTCFLHQPVARAWKRAASIACLAVLVVMLICLLPGRVPAQASGYAQPTPAPQSIITPAPTLNPEWLANTSQTNGIIIGAAVLVLIIVGVALQSSRSTKS